MITIDTRKVGKYLEVEVEINNTKIIVGLLDTDERIELAKALSQAVTDILNGV